MSTIKFNHVITKESELEERLGGRPIKMIEDVKMPSLDVHSKAFLQLSPFALIGTHDSAGNADVSPRGGDAGFTLVLDDNNIVIPERLGNRLADSLRNIMQTGKIGALFVVPGYGESMRINGTAKVIADEPIMRKLAVKGKPASVGIAIQIEEVYVHCARCMLRSGIWKGATYPDRKEWVSLAQLMIDQQNMTDITVDEMQKLVDEDYEALY